MAFDNADLFPVTAAIDGRDHLTLGGCNTADLAEQYGTPVYVYDEETLRMMCREFTREFTKRYPATKVLYAAKAFVNPALARLLTEEGLGLDVVSGGELAVAKVAGFPPERIYFHGNNKGKTELEMAVRGHIGRVVVDNFYELRLLDEIARQHDVIQDILLRLSPGVDPHTHAKTTTGVLDSKFGLSIETGDAEQAIQLALSLPNVRLMGIHFHLGSPIFELEPYSIATDTVLTFIARFISDGLSLEELSTGGGFAIGYLRDQLPPTIASYADAIVTTMKRRCGDLGISEPTLVVEPGRAIVGRAGVSLYTVGAMKDVPGVRKYVSLDGGMGDNIRPAMYDSPYEAVLASRMSDPESERVTLAGKFCESGDVLVRDIDMPILEPGDLIAIPAVGAYAPAMANNYNLNPKPAIVMVKDGRSRLIRRRETHEDMMHLDVLD